MATSTVKLWRVSWAKELNCVVDNIANYLTTPRTTYNDFQYIRNGLDITIKVPLSQANVLSDINYVSIKNSVDSRTFYYYIMDKNQIAESTVELVLSQDTLNTWQDLLIFTDRTHIVRQHKDRFKKPVSVPSTSFTITRDIDRIEEGLSGAIKYETSNTEITNEDSQMNDIDWYLVYSTAQEVNIEDTSVNSAIDCFLVPSSSSPVYILGQAQTLSVEDIVDEVDKGIWFTSGSFTINNVTYEITDRYAYGFKTLYAGGLYSIVIYRFDKVNGTVSNMTQVFGDLDDITVNFNASTYATKVFSETYMINMDLELWDAIDKEYQEFDSSGNIELVDFSKIDRTLGYIVKILKCPYCPIDFTQSVPQMNVYDLPDGFKTVVGTILGVDYQAKRFLKLNSLDTEFLNRFTSVSLSDQYRVTIPALNTRRVTSKNDRYESKLYHSDFYNLNFTYDSFTKTVPLENFTVTAGTVPILRLYYKQTNTINSNLLFKFEPHNFIWDRQESYQEYLPVDRNLEMPIYNSSYANYIRTGLRYDKKARNSQLQQGIANTVVSAAGSALGLGFSGKTRGISGAAGISMLTSTISNATSLVFNWRNANLQMEQKKAEAKNTAATVNGSDDIDLLTYYSSNRIHKSIYKISDTFQSMVYDLFFRTGYACDETGVPDVTSRLRFNYLRCEPDFLLKDKGEWKEYLEDITTKFNIGVTYFHRYQNAFDFSYIFENFEAWLDA